MSENSITQEKETFQFSFEIKNLALAGFTHLKLFNGYNEIVNEGYGGLNIRVPRGVYQLRIEMNEHVEDRNYRITGDVKDSISDFKTSSSVPLKGFFNTHNYFENPSSKWSAKSTVNGLLISGSSIFIFLRYSDKENSFDGISEWENICFILNEERELLYTLDDNNTRVDAGKEAEYYGSICFHVKVPPGQYYVVYKRKKINREIPVYVFENWQTQIFMMLKEDPLFGTTKISIERQGLSSANNENMQLDAIIQKMYNGIYVLPDDLKSYAVTAKWTNPMLGIITTYMYLLTDNNKDDALFMEILNNLQNNILNNTTAPDMVALRLLGDLHYKKEISQQPLEAPCMIVAGMNAFLAQSLKYPSLIKKESLVEKIYPKLQSASIWTSYEPLLIKTVSKEKGIKRINRNKVPKNIANEKFSIQLNVKAVKENDKKNVKRFNPDKDWITSSVFSQLSQSKKPMALTDLATQLQVTANTIKKSLNKLNTPERIELIAQTLLDEVKSVNYTNSIKKINSQVQEMLK